MGDKEPNFGGMTVNERLSAAGLLRQFDGAVNAGDRERAIETLMQVSMSASDAAFTVDSLLSNPVKYGYRKPS